MLSVLQKIKRFVLILRSSKYLSLVAVLVLVAVIPLTVIFSQMTQDTRQRAAEEEAKPQAKPEEKKPEFIQGEVLVKLKTPLGKLKFKPGAKAMDIDKQAIPLSSVDTSNLSPVIASINDKYKIKTLEKVFKGAQSPQEELSKFKSKFSQDISEGKRKINEQEFLKNDLSKTYKLIFENKDTKIEEIVEELKKSSDIEYVEPNFIYQLTADPNDPYFQDSYPSSAAGRAANWNPPFDYQWNIKQTNSSNNWQVDTSSVIVAVIDTGVDVTHPDLGGVWVNSNETPGDGLDNDNNGCIDDVNGCRFDYSAMGGDIADDNGHGTHVAGVISAKTNNALGIAGITNNAKIMGIKVFPGGDSDRIATAIRYAVDNGAKVINMSLSGPQSYVQRQALDYAVAANVVPVAGAANGNQYSLSHFPASYKNAITVGGVDEELNKMKYANYGHNIDVSAPGGSSDCMFVSKPGHCSSIMSLKSKDANDEPEHVVGGQYLRMSGTSMATPHVAGVVALLFAQHPEFTLQDIENYIRFNSIDPGGKGLNEKTGWGVINSQGNVFIPSTNINFNVLNPSENSLIGAKFDVKGYADADNFDRYEIEYRLQGTQEWKKDGVTLANSGKQKVPYNSFDPNQLLGSIFLGTSAPRGVYEIRVTLFLSSGRSLKATKIVNFLQKPGTKWLGDGLDTDEGKILVEDLDRDGKREIILFDSHDYDITRKGLRVYDSNFNLLWRKDLAGNAVVGEIDSFSSGKEIILQTKDKIYVFNKDGQENQSKSLDYRSNLNAVGNLMILDSDNNGANELYFYGRQGYASFKVYGFEEDKGDNNRLLKIMEYQTATAPLLENWPSGADIDGDGAWEIIVVNGYKIQALSKTGQLKAEYTYSGDFGIDAIVAADMDLDRKQEIIFHQKWGNTQMLSFVNGGFEKKWSYNNSNNISWLSVGNFNQDNYPEIYINVSGLGSGSPKIIDSNGNELFNQTEASLRYSWNWNWGVPLGDRDKNNMTETYLTGEYNLDDRAYLDSREYDSKNNRMVLKDGEWKPLQGLLFSYPYLTDLEGNGKVDLVISNLGIIEFDTYGKIYWPYRYHDSQRTASYNFPLDFPEVTPTPTPTHTPTPTPTPLPPSVSVSPASITAGGQLTIKWAVPNPHIEDAIVFSSISRPDSGGQLFYIHNNCSNLFRLGSVDISNSIGQCLYTVIPNFTPGEYKAVLLNGISRTPIATSEKVTIIAPPTSTPAPTPTKAPQIKVSFKTSSGTPVSQKFCSACFNANGGYVKAYACYTGSDVTIPKPAVCNGDTYNPTIGIDTKRSDIVNGVIAQVTANPTSRFKSLYNNAYLGWRDGDRWTSGERALNIIVNPRPTPTPYRRITPTVVPFVCTCRAADINKDNFVNVLDFSFLSGCYMKNATDKNQYGQSCAPADINSDRIVNGRDYACLSTQYSKKCQ